MTLQRRHRLELRADGSHGLVGYAAVFEERCDLGYCSESIMRGAFGQSISQNDVVCLVDHDPGRLLGRTSSGSLTLREDTHGLAFNLDLPDTSTGRDVLALAQRRDISGCSIGFLIEQESWSGRHRTLERVDLKEISIISCWPAYSGTEVKPRSRSVTMARRWLQLL